LARTGNCSNGLDTAAADEEVTTTADLQVNPVQLTRKDFLSLGQGVNVMILKIVSSHKWQHVGDLDTI
jgi:hypothetical protein